jgi:peptidoglycan LD-endopeptidase LytH
LKTFKKIAFALLFVVFIGLLIPQSFSIPVEGASKNSYAQNSFWFYPWGKSVTHKGVDIFANEGTNVTSSTIGLVINTGQNELGGNIILVLGPKWRLHYYAHLKEINTSRFSLVSKGGTIGKVGTTGNAKGKPAHLHYSIYSLLPYFWRIDKSPQGWKKMFFLNPIEYLNNTDL